MDEKKLEQILLEIRSYAMNVKDWQTIKKEILKSLPPSDRKFFSTRDPLTKQQTLNEFECKIVEKWEKLTNVKLIIKSRDARK
jgi:hypothetical protein